MDRPLLDRIRVPSWRHWRWLLCAPAVPALWACSTHSLAIPQPNPAIVDVRSFRQDVNHKLDILFMVDDSSSMQPLQTKMAQQLPTFMDKLVDQTTGQLPDLHVAVISSSQGVGAWDGVNACDSGNPGDDQGKFQQGPGGAGNGSCDKLHAGERYLKTGDGSTDSPPNFDGDIRPLFQCMALLGQSGCGFESQFKSTLVALDKAQKTADEDPDNGGFLRKDAVLAIVMVTNEDDCSVDNNSLLIDPGVNSAKDKSGLGALQSYRCNEFGHLCGGNPPPHGYNFDSMTFDLPAGTLSAPGAPGTGGMVLRDCVSAEDDGKTDPLIIEPSGPLAGQPDPTMGHLFPTVDYFTQYIKGLKDDPDDILVAAIAGPVEAMGATYRVVPVQNANGENDPWVDHSCVQASANGGEFEYGDPGVRIAQWVSSFGNNGVFYPICADTFADAMDGIADRIHQKLGASCVSGNIATNPDGGHACVVTQTITDTDTKKTMQQNLTECTDTLDKTPCYRLLANAKDCTDPNATTLLQICANATCSPTTTANESKDAAISCSLN